MPNVGVEGCVSTRIEGERRRGGSFVVSWLIVESFSAIGKLFDS